LDEVKQRAQQRLQDNFENEQQRYSDSLTKLGLNVDSIQDRHIATDQIGIKPPQKLQNNTDPTSPLNVVIKLEDLTLEEREHVLKVLITKINLSHRDMEGSMMKNQVNIKKSHKINSNAPIINNDDDNDGTTFITQTYIS